MTMTGSAARNDHAVLMACVQAPNHRYNVVHRLAESLRIGEKLFPLSTQELLMDRERKGIAIYPHLYMKESRFGNFRLQAWRFTRRLG